MRWIIGLAAACAAMPLSAQSGVAVRSAVFVEHGDAGALTVEPAARFSPGDSVVTIMSWQAPQRDRHTIVTALPRGLELESISRDGIEVSTDGGRQWHSLGLDQSLPRGVTHLRWRTGGDGQLSYRAVVR